MPDQYVLLGRSDWYTVIDHVEAFAHEGTWGGARAKLLAERIRAQILAHPFHRDDPLRAAAVDVVATLALANPPIPGLARQAVDRLAAVLYPGEDPR